MKKVVSAILVAIIFAVVNSTSAPAKASPQAPNASYWTARCCSYDGYPRCIMSVAVQDGTPCFCYGQGNGVAC
jgi:hypothetical protein